MVLALFRMVCKRVEIISEFAWQKHSVSSQAWEYMEEIARLKPNVYLEVKITAF